MSSHYIPRLSAKDFTCILSVKKEKNKTEQNTRGKNIYGNSKVILLVYCMFETWAQESFPL